MATTTPKPKLLVIVGPTASGKSALAMKIARKHNGEIIAADSRTVYKGMDIGTAKPSKADQAEVPHWGLDLIEPGQGYSAARFKRYAQERIQDIQSRGRLPIIVGGTGLYVDGLIFNFSFINPSPVRRFVYRRFSIGKLQKVIEHRSWKPPFNSTNARHLLRIVEKKGRSGDRSIGPLAGTTMIGLMPTPEALRMNISERADKMFASGVVDETKLLRTRYGEKALKSTGGIIYQACAKLINGELSQQEAKDWFTKADWQYARRQRTWFRRNPFIRWYGDSASAERAINQLLNT